MPNKCSDDLPAHEGFTRNNAACYLTSLMSASLFEIAVIPELPAGDVLQQGCKVTNIGNCC